MKHDSQQFPNMPVQEILPQGFYTRPACQQDLSAVVDLIRSYEILLLGECGLTDEEFETEWRRPGFELERDSWVTLAPQDGQADLVVGYQDLFNRWEHALLQGDGYVRPGYWGLGIGTVQLRLAEQRARLHAHHAPPGKAVLVRNGVPGADQPACQLHENEGYQAVRRFYQMGIHLHAPPPEPVWPEGLQVRAFVSGQDDQRAFAALEEAFRDHWSYTPWNFEIWRERNAAESELESSLSTLAFEDGQVAGGAMCAFREGHGWVSQLAVRRPWRRQGLGLALLRHSFDLFYRRGIREVRLGVDAANPTGATRLYEKAGMDVVFEAVMYEKEIRSGEKPAGQSS